MPDRSRRLKQILDIVFLLAGIAVAALFTTRYLMPFRLDDVLLMQWSNHHSLLDAFDPYRGQLINSFRPIYAVTAWLLTHLAGWQHPFWWHLTLVTCLLTALAFTGLTARYLAGRWYVLQLSILLYWLAFTSILNVFFWYSDLTFGLELAFTCPAWYLGLRGLYEGRLRYWIAAMALGSLAILSKEPAIVLVHVVLLGSFALERHRVLSVWKNRLYSHRIGALAAYGALLFVTIFIIFSSATRTNRFFPLDTPDLLIFIRDRIDYYSAIYLSRTARLLLVFPIVFTALQSYFASRVRSSELTTFLFITVLAIVLSLVAFPNILIGIPLLTFLLVSIAGRPNLEQSVARKLLPFLACLVIGMATLLVTVQLVKTQLTEMAILTIILSGWAWAVWIESMQRAFEPLRRFRGLRTGIMFAIGTVETVIFLGALPRIAAQERLLQDVRNVRINANEAIEWCAGHLPANSTVAVPLYDIHGISAGSVTSLSDSAKLGAQYTFDGGYVYEALEVLGRRDIRHAYLADSLMLPEILKAMREEPNSFLLLQSQLDLDLFHGIHHTPLINERDSLMARFERGPYPAELWLLRK